MPSPTEHAPHFQSRFPSPTLDGLSPILHFLSLSSFAYSFRFLVVYPTPINVSYGWHFQYLTIIGLTLATLTFTFGALADLTSAYSPNASARLFKAKVALSMCSTPLEVVISILYGSLRMIDRDLVMPEWAQLPLHADFGFHALPSLALTFDMLLLSPRWTITMPQSFGLSSALACGYWWWIERCFQENRFYPYPIFEVVGFGGRIGLFAVSALIMMGATVGLQALYGLVNGGPDTAKAAVSETVEESKAEIKGTLRR